MRDFITVDREANQIRLLRQTFPGAFLLVEGSSDKIFYERFIDRLTCRLVIVSGKPSSKLRVIEVLRILEQSNFKGVLAIIDADFERLETLLYTSPNLLRTDTHDLETMLIKSPAFDKVIAEFGSEEKIANRDVRIILLEIGISVGYLRWISLCDDLNLSFDININFFNEKTLQIDEIKLIREVKNKSQKHSIKDEDLQQRLTSQKNNGHDPWEVCCGHDLVKILSTMLRKAIGSNETADVEQNRLERNLRLAYEEVYFCTTQIYQEIQVWESKNFPFKVLRNDT